MLSRLKFRTLIFAASALRLCASAVVILAIAGCATGTQALPQDSDARGSTIGPIYSGVHLHIHAPHGGGDAQTPTERYVDQINLQGATVATDVTVQGPSTATQERRGGSSGAIDNTADGKLDVSVPVLP